VVVNAAEPYVRLFRMDTLTPAWGTSAVLANDLRVRTHRGWDPAPPPASWAALTGARQVVQGLAPTVCRYTDAGEVEVWASADAPGLAARRVVEGLAELYAHPDGCVVRGADGDLRLLPLAGDPVQLAADVLASAVVDDAIVVAVPHEVRVLVPDGFVRERWPTVTEVTAVGVCGGSVCWGDVTGRVHVAGGAELRDTPSARVTALATGPGGVVLAGFANGVAGVWGAADGRPLLSVHLHGPVRHLVHRDQRVLIATDNGDVERLDLTALTQGYCELLREVWASIPAVPRDQGRALVPPDPRHRCAG
jgi:hypothetical protein